MKFENLGDYCKWLEKNFSLEIMIPKLPIIIRFDGNCFHNYCKGLKKPFDENLTDLMIETTKFLVQETNAIVGYHQSDEITLILYADNIYHEGKKQKILSKLTGKLVSFFNEKRKEFLPKHTKIANFDCRIYQVPTLKDACNQLLWRENDAVKNSIYMLAHSLFPHKQLQNLHGGQLQDKMMLEKNVNWNDLPSKFKWGTYVKRIKTSKSFTRDDLKNLPPNHHVFSNPNIIIDRHVLEIMEYPQMSKISNREEVIFNNQPPIPYDKIL